MKSRETKQKDLVVLTEQMSNSNSAMVVGFTKLTVAKDQEFRSKLREVGASYKVVKNTLARIAVKDTAFEGLTPELKGVTAIAWTDSDSVVLSKAVSTFIKENADNFTFKSGVVDGKIVGIDEVNAIASLPSKEVLISKLLFIINSQAQRIVTVINAVPRDLAVVVKQIGEKAGDGSAPEKAEAAAPETSESETTEPGTKEDAPVEHAEEAQETKENEQDPASPEAEQADEAKDADEGEPEAEGEKAE